MSFFLWSSIPDADLIDLAARGKLKDPAVVEQQVRRMLADPRADALVENFAAQWLNLGKIAGVKPDEYVHPEFDENLRDAMLEETRRFLTTQIREDRSVVDLLSADYTFINDRLARHYGIPDVFGNQFRRVTFKDGVRGGLLGQASVLTVTSYPNRTSPVVRGKWLLDNMLGAPPPPPPPDVPTLVEPGEDNQPRSVRERLEAHRKNPTCAACHVRMDPLGFALENFDALGKWRTSSDGVPVDAAASLPDGTQFDGIVGLRKLLVDHRDEFVRTLTEKLLSYAIGRGIEHFDLPTVRQIARDARTDQPPMVGVGSRHREKYAVHHGNYHGGIAMMISKKALSRRTVLRGLGTAVALPLLDSMLPAFTAVARSAAAPINRFGVMYVPNGMIMQNWAPIGEGVGYQFNTTMVPLSPFAIR